MGDLFKINLIPKVKDRDWEVKNIGSNRKNKVCEICKTDLKIRDSSTTFTKRVSKGYHTEYITHDTCNYNKNPLCAIEMSKILNIDLDSSFVH